MRLQKARRLKQHFRPSRDITRVTTWSCVYTIEMNFLCVLTGALINFVIGSASTWSGQLNRAISLFCPVEIRPCDTSQKAVTELPYVTENTRLAEINWRSNSHSGSCVILCRCKITRDAINNNNAIMSIKQLAKFFCAFKR